MLKISNFVIVILGQPPILKNFYVEDPEIAGMSDEEVKAVR